MEYDAFISHASEDKDELVRPLATKLSDLGIKVWYDEFELHVGDSLRRRIDQGLATSRKGIVILSRAFFAKAWPQQELDAIFQMHLASPSGTILPVWHGLTEPEVRQHSPLLAGIVALSSALGIETLSKNLASAINPDFATPRPGTPTTTRLVAGRCTRPRQVIFGPNEGNFYHMSPHWLDHDHESGRYFAPKPFLIAGMRPDIVQKAVTESKVLLLRDTMPRSPIGGMIIQYQFVELTEPDIEDLPCMSKAPDL